MSQRNIDDDYELDHYIETIENWRPVIKAAKAWLHSASPRDERDHVYCRHRLGEAIETLEAAEGEE